MVFKDEEEQRLYESAVILELHPGDNCSRVRVEYRSPPEVRASSRSSNIFKAGTLVNGNLYTCTSTEVLMYEVPSFKRIGYVSLPCFNDLHHVTPTRDENLLVANTGLDMGMKVTPRGELLAAWDVLDEVPWSRFSREADYRKVESTKPHRSHPNFVFELGDDVWVTRFFQRDAICLTDRKKRIDLGGEKPHDGVALAGYLYFTTVDGRLVIVNATTLLVETIVDLNQIEGDGAAPLGWCRAVLPLSETLVWVGFTRVRKTKFVENLLWVKHGFRERERPTHIRLYDIVGKNCLREIELETLGLDVIFGIYPAPQCA